MNQEDVATPAYNVRDLPIEIAGRRFEARVLSPENLATEPLLLLTVALDRDTTLREPDYNGAGMAFLSRGHRVVSFDPPNHGSRIDDFGQGIVGYRNAWAAGHDPFQAFVQDAGAVIDACIGAGLARPSGVVACGASRSGYKVLRLMAADCRIAAAAAIAPVTDWRYLTEFAADRDNPAVAALRLSNYVDALAGKRIFIIIGYHDDRVSTSSCCRVYADLMDINVRLGHGTDLVDFLIEPTQGHGSLRSWYDRAAEFLLRNL